MFNTVPDNVNPVFSQAKDPDFNENMDEYVKAPYDIYIEEQKKAAPKSKRNVNAEALDDIPEMPDFLYEQYQEMNKLPDIYNRLNVVSQQELRDWEKQGKMGIAETWAKKRKWEMVPFSGTTADTTLVIRNANTLRKIKKGEQVSDTDLDLLVEQLRDMKELEVRGCTLGGAALDTLMTCIPYAAEFGISLATLPEGVGGAGFAKMLATAASKKAARKAVEAAVKEAAVESTMSGVKKTVSLSAAKNIYKTAQNDFLKQGITKAAVKGMGEVGALKTAGLALKATPGSLAKAVRVNMTRIPQHFVGGVADRQLSRGVYITDTGDSVFTQSENLATSIMKSFADTTLDAWTESMGWGIGGVTGYFAKPLRKLLPKTFFSGFEKLVSSRYGMPAAEALRKYGYDGVIEEMGEEQLSRLLCQVFGVNSDNLSDYFNFDSFMNNVFYFDRQGKEGMEGLKAGLKSAAEGYGTEALSFAAMSGGGHITSGAVSKGVEQWNKNKTNNQIKDLTDKANKLLYSPEQFYLDQGFIKIKGSQSLAEQKLRDIWTGENVPEGLQNSVLQSMSQYEIQNTLKKIVENDSENKSTSDKEKQKQEIKNIFYKKAIAAGVSDEQADALAQTVSFFAQKYVPDNIDPKEWISKLNIKKNIPADKILKGGIEYNDNPNYEIIENKLNQLSKQYDNLPDDFNDEQTINQYLDEMQVLADIQDGNINKNNIEQIQNLIREYKESEPELAGALENTLNKTETHFQSAAMYKSPKENFAEFYNQVFEKEKQAKENNTKLQKSYFDYTDGKISVRVPHDTVAHDKNKHNLSADEWTNILENLSNIENAGISKKSNSNDKVALLKINTPNGKYGVTIQFANGANQISTAFKSTDKGIDDWIKKGSANRMTSEPSSSSRDDNTSNAVALVSQNLNDIISYIKERIKSNDVGSYFQSAQSAGANDNEIAAAKKEWQEKGTDSRFFKKWFGNSKVVDKEGKPLVVYHGTKSNFDVFNKKGSSNSSTSRIGYWFSDSKEFAENFTKDSFYGDTDDRIVMPVYLSMKNPKVYTKRIVSQKELEEANTKVKNIEKEIKEFTTRCNKLYSETGSWYEVNKTIGGDYYEEKQKLEKKLKKAEGEYGELKYTDPYFQLQTDIHKIDGGDANTANMGGGVGSALKDYDSPQKFVDSLKKQGYDGIIIKGTEADSEYSNDKPNNQYVVFEPEQIKSVDNQGTFDSNNPNIYYQSVYHGTPHRFDEFSTEHIGTGEGAQAHGWGLYFAEDKNVSEDYRETLAQSLKNAKYNGKLIYETELVKLDSDIKNILFLKGKKEALEKLEQNKKDAEKNINGNSNFLKRYSEKFLKNYDEQLEILKNVDESKITDVKKGQLFEVDIPEDDVLLDEDKTLSEQPEKVQKAIRQYFFSQYTGNPKDFNYEWILKYFGIETGRDFYETVAKLELEGYHKNPEKYEFQPAAIYLQNSQEKYELASKKLNSIGIKGITYNGRQDGRCYVVFDDKAVKVLKTYYQSVNNGKGLNNNVVDLTNDFEKTPSLDDVKKYINRLINEGVKFATSSPGWFVDIKGGKRIKNKILNAGNYKNLDKMERKRHNKYVMSLEKLLSNAVHTGEKENTKKDKKPDVEKYHYFKTTAKIGDKTYEIIFDTEEYKNDKTASVGHAKRDLKETEADINSITDNTEKINPKTVHLYNITELKPNNTYFYGESYDELLQKHNDKLEKQKDEYKGYFAEGLNVITLMDNADASTLPHELAHFFLASLNEFAKTSDKAREQLEEVDKRLGRIAGEDYTTEQHERFARWFEAYLYTGKSPSYRLKEVFENFKEWLKNIAEYWAQNYEMPKDVKKMFDRMFGEEQTLYNEEQEKKIKEALAKVESVTLSNKLTDRQKRHKEAAYQILAKATGLSKKYLMSVLEARNSNNKSIRKKQENIQMLLEHTDDKITVSDGMLLNWLEFYPDTGVSYDNQEVHADIELAQMAYDDIINGSWVTEVDEYDYINTADAQYQYLLKLFENGKNRDIIYSVFWKWLDNQDKFVQDIFAEQFENDMTQIEHKEHSLEFERIKQKILAEARKIDKNNDVDGVKRYKQIVLTTMKNLKFLTPEDKAAIATKIFDCPTLSFLEAKIDSILDMSKTLNERDYRRRLFSQIDKILEGTKNIQQGNKMVGRYDYTSNKIFESLRAINKLNGEAAKRYITDMQTLIDVENSEDSSGLSYEVKLCNMLAQIRAAGMKRPYKNTQLIKQFVDELNKMKLAARASVTEQQFLEKLDNQRDINEVINILTPMKSTALPVSIVDSIGKANFLKNVKTVLASHDSMGLKAKQLYTYTVANWESLVNTIFGKKIRNKYSMLQEQAQAAVWKDNMKKRFIEGAARIYNCKLRDFDNEILKNLSQVWEFQEAIRTKNPKGDYILNWTPIRMNKMEILLAWMWNKNDVLSERLKNQFGEQQLYDEMFDLLTDKDKEFGEFMMSLINEVYAPANERYIKKYGIELPKVQAYFPSSVERGSEIDLLSDYIMKSSAPSAIKTRSNATTLRMKFSNPVAIFFNHIDCMGDFICLTDKVDKINKVFRNPVVVSLIKNKFGDATFKELNQQIINFSYKKQADTANWLDKITSQVVNNWLSGTLSLKASVGFRQLLSAPNYAVNMPVVKWTAGFALAWLHPKETIDYMMKIPYLRVRFESSGQNEALQQFVNSVNISKIKKFKEFLMLNVRLGDIGAIIFGGKPYLDYLIKEKNMTEEAAIAAFVDQTNRTQQSSLGSSLSNFQTASKNRGISQLFTAYRNTQNQYIRLVADEIIDYRNAINNNEFANAKEKNEAKVKLAKTIFNYMFMQPLLYTLATTLSVNRAFNRSGDDDWKKDVLTSIFDLNAKAISLFGDLYQYIVQVIAGNSETAELVPIIGDFKTEINKAAKEDTRTEGILGLACVMTHAGIGVDVKTPINELSGVKDILDGDVQKGAYRILGNSEYRAKYAVGEE